MPALHRLVQFLVSRQTAATVISIGNVEVHGEEYGVRRNLVGALWLLCVQSRRAISEHLLEFWWDVTVGLKWKAGLYILFELY